MKNYSVFVNSFQLINLYFRDSLQGILRQPFFKNKKNRYFTVVLTMLAYLFYFYINVVEYARLSSFGQQSSLAELKRVISVSISSYNNLAILAGLFIFLLTNTTVKLTRSSLYLSKILPFHEKEVYLSVKWFKLGIALTCFELFFMILVPGLGLLQSPLIAVCLFFSSHIFFFSSYGLFHLIYVLILKYMPLSAKGNHFLGTIVYFIFGLFYLFSLRFHIDAYLAQLGLASELLAIGFVFVSLFSLFLIHAIDRVKFDFSFLKQVFVQVPSLPLLKGKVKWNSLAIIRTKFFLYNLLFILFIGCYAFFTDGITLAISQLLNIWPFLGISFVYYADSTLRHRMLYRHLGIGIIEEVLTLLATIGVTQLPAALGTIYLQLPPITLLQGIALSLASLVIGFLFPRSTSSSNETVSLVLLLLVIILMLFIARLPLVLLPVIGILLLLLIYVIKKEMEIK